MHCNERPDLVASSMSIMADTLHKRRLARTEDELDMTLALQEYRDAIGHPEMNAAFARARRVMSRLCDMVYGIDSRVPE